MSIERMQTVMSFTAEGVQQLISQIRQIAQETERLSGVNSPLASLPTGLQRAAQGQAPRAFNDIERLQARQAAAEYSLISAKEKHAAIVRKQGESESAFEGRQAAASAAALRASASVQDARRDLATGYRKLADELAGTAAAESLERQRRRGQAAQVAADYNTQQREERALTRTRLGDAAAANRRAVQDEQRAVQSRLDERRAGAQVAFGGAVVGDAADDARHRQARESLIQAEKDAARVQEQFNARRRREATEAFMTTPHSEALSREEISALTATPTRYDSDSDKVFRAREILADAQIQRGTAESNFADSVRRAESDETMSHQARVDAINRARVTYDVANRRVVDAQARLERALDVQALAHAQNRRTSTRESFLTGFRGRGDNVAPYAEQLGQAFKFSVFYGAAYKLLFGLTQTLASTFQEGVAFQEGMTNLALATDRPREQLDEIADKLGASATRAGFAPSQGIEIGARSLGLYGVTDSDAATQNRVMQISSRVVNQLAVGSEKTPVDLQGDIAAVAQALGMGAAGQFRIADLDAYMTKKFGVAQGSTLDVVAQSASVGKAAGFSDEQLFAVAADLLSRTGQSGSAVSGYMAQIFSRGGEGSLVNVATRQGIDPNQDLAAILAQLATVYQSASTGDQAEISAAFGRGKIQNAAVALLADYDEVLQRSGQALTDASGQADKQFAIRMEDIGGQVELLMGVMKDFASQLGESGLLDVLGLGIITFREFLELVNGFLRVWNQLPNAVQDVIIGLVALKVALSSGLVGGAANGLLGRAGTAGAVGQFRRTAGGAPVFVSAAGAASPIASRAGVAGLARAGGAALGLIGPIGLAVTGLLAIGALKNAADRMRTATESGVVALQSPSAGVGSTSSEFQAYASELRSYARDNRDATPWWLQGLSFGQANNDNENMADRLDREATRVEGVAARMEAEASRAGSPERMAFASFSSEDIASGLQLLENGGATASQQLRALNDTLFGTARAADAAAKSFNPKDFAAEGAGDLKNAISQTLKGISVNDIVPPDLTQPGPYGTTMTTATYDYGQGTSIANRADVRARLEGALSGSQMQGRYQDALSSFGVNSAADIDATMATRMASTIGSGIAASVLKPYGAKDGVISKYQKEINAAIAAQLVAQASSMNELLSGDSPLTSDEATAAAMQAVQLSESSMGNLAEVDTAGRIRNLRSRVRTLNRIQGRTRDPIGIIGEQVADARRQIAQAQFEDLERLRRVAQRNADSKAEITEIGQSFLGREIRAAIRGGNTDLLVTILEQAGKGAADIARKVIRDALAVIDSAIETALLLNNVGQEIDGVIKGAAAGFREGISDAAADETNGPLRKRRRELNSMLAAIGKSLSGRGDDNVYGSGSDSGNPLLDPDNKTEEDKETRAEREAARASALATRSRNPVAAARASLLAARAAMAEADANSVEYYSALEQYYDAQNALADALSAVASARASARASRVGGAIAGAAAEMVSARESLRNAEGDQAAYWAAMGEMYEAQRAMRDAVLAHRKNQMLLGSDMTNPLSQARIETRSAAQRLRSDIRSGQAPDVIAQDRVDLRNAQANQEATAFSQRLQSVQTAEELGRISHGKYMNYLDNEKRRLEGIKNRTFQQQEQLDQIDRLMKDAATAMEGQFNLGDIKLPTPYQVRRYVEQTSPARTERMAASSSTTHNFAMYVNGADVGVITKVVKEQVGKGSRVRTPAPRRRS